MSKLLDKVMGVIGFETDNECMEPEESYLTEPEKDKKQKRANLLSLPTQKPVAMILVRAKSYEEVESIAQNIKERRSVIVNFEEVEKDTAQHMIDFLSGAVFALDGVVQKVSIETFLFATCNLDVVGQITDEEREKIFFKGFSWTKK